MEDDSGKIYACETLLLENSTFQKQKEIHEPCKSCFSCAPEN